MESCIFRKPDGSRCGSKFETKEVEFRHPDYKDLNQRVFLCQSHFHQIFGEPVARKESMLPLEVEKWLELLVRNEEKRYVDTIKEVGKKVKDGVGNDYFDWDTFKANNRRKLDQAKEALRLLRRGMCRFEWCNQKLTNFRNMYIIRIYPKKQTDYVNLFFCCLDHWEVYKKRIGLQTLKGKLDTSKRKASLTLDNYNGMIQ